jgi:hypothetical protein
MINSPSFSKGKLDEIGFIFSCPGKVEAEKGAPAQGHTGKNLNSLLEMLSSRSVDTSLRFDRQSITIANAWDRVEYSKFTERSEARDTEIKSVSNINRLAQDISGIRCLLVFCGRAAALALAELEVIRAIQGNVVVCTISHLGYKGLNRIGVDGALRGSAATIARLDICASKIHAALRNHGLQKS